MSERERTIQLFSPSSSKAVQLVARDDDRLDLGSIARTFGLEPSTLKLNGHFISRGVDLIASSVTWKSLLSFFSSRGLSTGANASGALVVDGKLSKSGSKRGHDSIVDENGIPSTSDLGYDSIGRKPLCLELNSNKKRRFKDSGLSSDKCSTSEAYCLKRKQEDVGSLLKRLKVDETQTNSGSRIKENTCAKMHSTTQFSCSFLGVNIKRMREDENVHPASCKKIR